MGNQHHYLKGGLGGHDASQFSILRKKSLPFND